MKQILLFTLFSLVLFPHFTSGQIPQTISYQGVLTNVNGTPVVDGSYSLTFKLYDVPINGDSLWQETQNVQVTSGLFNVILGSVTPLNLPFDKQYWMGIAIGSGSELTPRIALTASPYSLNSHSTLAETQPGQGLTIRNSSGEATHQFDANGDVTHNGVGKFLGGIVVGDTIIVLLDTSGSKIATIKSFEISKVINVDLPLFGIKGAGSDVGVFGDGGNIGVYGQSKGTVGIGVLGYNETNYGVFGKSVNGIGVAGITQNGDGVLGRSETKRGVLGISQDAEGILGQSNISTGSRGVSTSGTGVWGSSQSGRGIIGQSNTEIGVFGSSEMERGVYGQSSSSAGVYGTSGTNAGVVGKGVWGGWFLNKIRVDEVPLAPDQARFLVWDNDNVVKYRTMPTTGGFDGVLQDKALVVKSGQTEVFRVDTNGASYHKGVETFDDDVIFKGTDGKGAKLVDGNGVTIGGFGRKDLDTGQRIGVYGKAENPGDLAGVFDGDVEVNGEIVTGSLHIVNGNGDTLTSFNADGTSYHTGVETYLAGIDLPDNNTENTTGVVKAGKFNGGLTQLSFTQRQLFPNSIEVPRLDGGTLSFKPTVDNEPTIWGYTERINGAAVFGQSTNTTNTYPANWGVNFGGGSGVVGEVRNTSSNYPGVWAIEYGTGSALLVDHQGSTGNIFTGRSAGVNQVRIDKTGKGFFNGGTQTGGADVAEAFEVEGIVEEYEPGDVLIISTQTDRTIIKSSEPYSTLVAGVYATKPGVLLTERGIDDSHEDTVPLGVVGVIPTKISGENGSIQRGDLLVTSSISGHAMKGTDREKLMGAVLGKALENFDGSGTGVIKVLVNTK